MRGEDTMNYMAMKAKTKKRSHRMVSTISVLSILGSTSATSNSEQGTVKLRGNKPHVASVRDAQHRILKQKKYEGELPPRPPTTEIADTNLIQSHNASISGNDQNDDLSRPSSDQDVRTPYYPDLASHTCHADNNYPEHYLYDIKAYFSHSPHSCCQMHFTGNDVDACIENIVDDSLGINSGTMMMKTEALGMHPIEVRQSVASVMSAGGETGTGASDVAGAVDSMGIKKPILAHGTTWYSGGDGYDTESAKAVWSSGDDALYSKQVRCDYTGWGGGGGDVSRRALGWGYGLVGKSNKAAKTKSAKSKSKAAKSEHSESPVDDDYYYYPCVPSSSPNQNNELMPITPIPTYAPITPIPTYAPSSMNESTYFPTMNATTYFPTMNATTYAPTMNATTNFPTTTTYAPTAGDVDTSIPTYVPTTLNISTFIPTVFPTFTPTYSETMAGTISNPLDLLVWGSALSTSQPETDGNILVPLDTTIDGIDASAGTKYSLVVNPDGEVYSTGFISDPTGGDYHGHLGVRPQDLVEGQNMWIEIERVFDPDQGGVTFPPPFMKVYAGVENNPGKGDIHTILLDVNGNAWATGSNEMGQLCLDDTLDKMIPQRIPIKNIVDVAVGGQHTLLLDNNGTVYGCGSNEFGQLGIQESVSSTPVPLELDLQVPATTVSAGKEHSLIMTEDGNYVMGSNKYGQLCVDTNGDNVYIPSALDVEARVAKAFVATQYSSYLLYVDGSVNSCGRNDLGQLGDGTNEDAILVTVAMPEESKAVRLLGVGPSSSSAFFVSEFETVWGTGKNSNGQLGVGDEENRNIPTLVELQDNVLVYVLSSAEDHTLMLKQGGVNVTQTPTLFPTSDATISTSSPTTIPTFAPTLQPTSGSIPTFLPTTSDISTDSPTQTGIEYFFWGAPEAVGKSAETPDVTVPLNVGSGATYSGVGTKYTIVILADGSAMAAGYVQSIDDYQGHLGLDPELVVQGVNEFQQITQVYDPANAGRKLQSTIQPTTATTVTETSIPSPQSTLGLIETTTPTYFTSLDPTSGTTPPVPQGTPTPVESTYQPTVGSTPSIGTVFVTLAPTSESTPTVYSVHSLTPTPDPIDAPAGLSALTDAPLFDKVFAGVENIPDTGEIHSILLDKFGNVWAMGNNEMGQLCLGDNVDRMIPERVAIDSKVIDVAVGGEHTLLLLEDGSVYGCGSNAVGQLGIAQNEVVSPTILDGLTSPVTSVSAGHSHSLFMASDGIYLTGSNEYGQLCTDTNGQNVLTITAFDIDERVAISFEAIKQSSFILYEDGSVNSCGRNDFGQLGDGTNDDEFLVSVDIPDRVVRLLGVGPSSQSVLFVTTDDLVWSTGLNDRGQLGVGDTVNRNIPTRVKFDGLVSIDQLCIAEDHSFALGVIIGTQYPTQAPSPTVTVPAMKFYFWGVPDSIGEDIATDVLTPFESGDQAIDTSGGSDYTVIILNDGTALSAGYIDALETYAGHLGRDEATVIQGVNEMLPISLVYDSSDSAIVDAPVFIGAYAGVENSPDSGIVHTILLDAQGQAWAMGSNGNGQLCLGESVDKAFIPEKISFDGKIVDVAIGGEHTLLLDESGNVYGCGSNAVGQLGLGTTSKASVPTMIDGLASIISVSAGHSHSLFKSDSGIYFTGSNEFGQLCKETNGENIFTPESLDIPGIESSIGFEAIRSSSYILYSDGSVNGCGNNEFGQLGDGTNSNQVLSLVEVDGVVRLLGVGPSAESVFFITNDEYVWGTGLNDRGQLGIGDTENKNLPAQVLFEELVVVDVLSAAGNHTVALGLSSGTYPPNTAPSLSPILDETRLPTFSPTLGSSKQGSAVPTLSTIAPTVSSTSSPTTASSTLPTVPGSSVQGDMHYWGASGSLGKTPPDVILSPLSSGIIAASITAGSKYSILVYPNGTAVSSGFIESVDDYHGHLGQRGDEVTTGENPFRPISSVYNAEEDLIIDAPFFVRAFAGVSQLSSPGLIHTILIDDGGQAWATGSNNRGQLCLGDFDDRLVPERIPLDGKVESAAIGSAHSLLLLEDGTVFGCGSNDAGQLGLDAISETETPTVIEGIPNVQSLSAGFDYSLFKGSDGLYVTGNNLYGQLCVNETIGENVTTPYLISDVDVSIVSSFDAIRSSSYISFNDGSVGACGRNNFGQLGDGTNNDRVRTVLEPLPDKSPIRNVYGGPSSESVFFVSDSGATYATGLNDKAQLGVGDQLNRNVLTLVEFGEGVIVPTQISASGDHTLSV